MIGSEGMMGSKGVAGSKGNLRIFLGIALLAALLYGNSFLNQFAFDDHKFILENPSIRSFQNIPSFFSQDVDKLYRPLRQALYTATYAIWNTNAFGYHLQSLLFHILNSFLVFLLAEKILRKRKFAFAAALLFTAHPIHTERVTNITAGFDQLGIFLLLASLLAYIWFREQHKKAYLWQSLGLFILGLLSSEEAVIVLPLAALFDFFSREPFRKRLKVYVPYAGITVLYLGLRFWILGIGKRAEGFLPYTTFATMGAAIIKYIRLLFIPFPLTVQQGIFLKTLSFFSPQILVSFAIILLLVSFAFFYRKRFPEISFGIFWFFIALLPFLHFIPIQTVMAERYLYVPSAGFAIILAFLAGKAADAPWRPAKKIIAYPLLMIILASYGVITVARNADWRDDLTLWQRTIEVSPWSSFAHDNLGFAFEQKGELTQAIAEFKKAISLDSENYQAYANLGVAYLKKGEIDAAARELETARRLNPSYAKSYHYLGVAYQKNGDLEKAREFFLTAISLDGGDYEAHNNLGVLYAQLGQTGFAKKEFLKAISLKPNYAEAQYNLKLLKEIPES